MISLAARARAPCRSALPLLVVEVHDFLTGRLAVNEDVDRCTTRGFVVAEIEGLLDAREGVDVGDHVRRIDEACRRRGEGHPTASRARGALPEDH